MFFIANRCLDQLLNLLSEIDVLVTLSMFSLVFQGDEENTLLCYFVVNVNILTQCICLRHAYYGGCLQFNTTVVAINKKEAICVLTLVKFMVTILA